MKKTGTCFVHYKHFLANNSKKVQQKQRKDIVQYSMYRRSLLTAEAKFRDKRRDLCAWSGFQYKFNLVNFYLEFKSFNTKTNIIKVSK